MPKYGYKFVFCNASDHCLALIKLEIPDDAKIVRPYIGDYDSFRGSVKLRTNKCRFIDAVAYFQYSIYYPDNFYKWISGAEFVINSIKNETPKNKLIFASIYDPAYFVYKFKCYHIESHLNLDINEQCTEGIHFFETENEAVSWIRNGANGEWINNRYNEFAEIYKIK